MSKAPSCGPWRLAGIEVVAKCLHARYERVLGVQMPDRMWRQYTETKTQPLDAAMHAAAIPLYDYEALSKAYQVLNARLIELAHKHVPPMEDKP
jgi:hypothetical protein